MYKNSLAIAGIACALFLSSCGGSSTTDSSAPSMSDKEMTSREISDLNKRLCTIFTAEDMAAIAKVDSSEINTFDMFGCQYGWDKANAASIEAENNQIYASFSGDLTELGEALLPTENKVELSLSYTGPNTDYTFRSSTNRLTEEEKTSIQSSLQSGIENSNQLSTELERDTATSLSGVLTKELYSGTYTDINGLGDQAAWSEDKKTLVVREGTMILTVKTELEEGTDLESSSTSIAEKVLSSL